VSDPVSFRPRRLRKMSWVLAAAIVIVCTSVSFGLHGSLGDGAPGAFQRGDQLAMIGLGVVAAIGVLMFARPRVVADQHMVHIRNVIGGYDLPWEVVRSVRFSRGSAWASLELEDDDLVGVLAIQANDKEYAVGAVRTLRALLEENRAARAAASESAETA
jgi:hypothetical protein